MTNRELFEMLHKLFRAELQRHHQCERSIADLIRVIGKNKNKSDSVIYRRYLAADPEKRQTPRVEEMQRMCREWTAAGYRAIEVKVSLVLEER